MSIDAQSTDKAQCDNRRCVCGTVGLYELTTTLQITLNRIWRWTRVHWKRSRRLSRYNASFGYLSRVYATAPLYRPIDLAVCYFTGQSTESSQHDAIANRSSTFCFALYCNFLIWEKDILPIKGDNLNDNALSEVAMTRLFMSINGWLTSIPDSFVATTINRGQTIGTMTLGKYYGFSYLIILRFLISC